MAWGIIMTVVTLVGMLGLTIFNVSQESPYLASEDLDAVALAAVRPRLAA